MLDLIRHQLSIRHSGRIVSLNLFQGWFSISFSRIFTYIISIKSFVSCSLNEISTISHTWGQGERSRMHWCKLVHRYVHAQILSGSLVHCALYGVWVVRLSETGPQSLRLVDVSTHAFFYCIKSVDWTSGKSMLMFNLLPVWLHVHA
jgi:hypothetical protein